RIALSVLSCAITCAIRAQWKKLCKAVGSTGQSLALHASLRSNTQVIGAGKTLHPGKVSPSRAKRLRHSCSMRLTKGNIFERSWASRNDPWQGGKIAREEELVFL